MNPGTTPFVVDDLLALDDARLRAMLAADVDALANLLHPALEYTHSDGRSDSRESYLQALRDGQLRYHRCARESAAVSLHGEVALVQGRLRLHALDQGQPKGLRIHYLAVWLRTADAAWQLRAWASTLVEKIA